MAKIVFPNLLEELLKGSNLQAPIRALADQVGEILSDCPPFFPYYTNHGVEHINSVLKSEVELVPKEVWQNSKVDSDQRLLCDADAVVIIGATLLHDIAMHLWPKGFLDLVGKESRFQPLPWFKESQNDYSADRSWHELWEDYIREARRFNERQLTDIIGEQQARNWKFPVVWSESSQWDESFRLIVGEFIRRHHTRLAHEIAIYGFPGLPIGSGMDEFTALGKKGHPLENFADLIGITARSHGIPLRVCSSYLDSNPLLAGTPRPMGSVALYAMAILRVADYLQIDQQRAPAVLLQLRDPQSPVSVQEWEKHKAVVNIGDAKSHRGKMVTISSNLSLPLYLQIKDLLAGLQAEIDHSTAVLDEVYGVRNDLGLHQLGLAIRRVESNLRTKAFEDRLLYVPKRTGFSADPNILTLLVEPLYGKEPSVGVRELIQNAVDAVRELEAWNNKHGEPVASIGKPKTGYDVLVEFVEQKQGMWLLRVKDNGIGMKSDTIQNYFLRAGASFRFSPEYAKEFLNDNGQCIVPRAGRFGIGAFAIFLLGPTFKLWTRHVSADESSGFKLEASTNSQLIEIQRALDLPVGTTIELEISSEAARGLGLTRDKRLPHQIHPASLADWFCWDWPKVAWRTIGSTPQHHLLAGLQQKVVCPIRKAKQPPEWSVIRPQGFDAVHWTFSNAPTISCNGVVIGRPTQIGHSRLLDNARYDWPFLHGLRQPAIAVLDPEGKLPLTIQRYNLAETRLPFLDDLRRDVVASFIAHALICGPRSSSEALSMERRHPLQSKPCSNYHSHPPKNMLGSGLLRWCVTSTGMVPAEDPWLCKLLNAKTCVVFGGLGLARETARPIEYISIPKMLEEVGSNEHALLPWYGSIAAFSQQPRINLRWDTLKCFVEELSGKGVAALGHTAKTNRLFFSVKRSNIEDTILKDLAAWTPSERDDKERCYFQLESDSAASPSNLKHCLAALETAQWIENGPLRGPGNVTLNGLNDLEVLFVAEVTINGVDSPQSALAQVWNDFLGPQIIPFDLAAREALIAEASKNAELKRHIEAWREMKRARSKWTPQ